MSQWTTERFEKLVAQARIEVAETNEDWDSEQDPQEVYEAALELLSGEADWEALHERGADDAILAIHEALLELVQSNRSKHERRTERSNSVAFPEAIRS